MAAAVAEIAAMVVADAPADQTLVRVVEVAQDAVPAADISGLTVAGEGLVPSTAYCTDALAYYIDQAQYDANRGPCLDAWRRGQRIRIDDTSEVGQRYPEFAKAAARAGIASSLSVPISFGGRDLGALNLYSHRVHAFTADDERAAQQITEPVGTVMVNIAAYWKARNLANDLEQAMKSRAVIEQAKGIVMATMACDADTAFDVLRAQSQAENRKLREVAAELVSRQHR